MNKTSPENSEATRVSTPGDRCEHSEGVYILRRGDGRCVARCLACGAVGSPRAGFDAALRDLQQGEGRA